MKYDYSKGVLGNLEAIGKELGKAEVYINNNKAYGESAKNETDDGLMDIASVASDEADASVELADMVAELYDAVAELAEMMAER